MIFPRLVDALGNRRPITLRTVHIVFETPLPTGSGAHQRNLAINASLSALGPSSLIAVQPLLPDPTGNAKRQPSFIAADLPDKTLDTITGLVVQAAPDVCIVDGVFLSQIAERIGPLDLPLIVDMHNVESVLQEDIDRARYGWRAALLRRRRWALARAADQRLVQRADQVWTCSSRDAELVRAIAQDPTPIDVVPNPVPPWCAAAQSGQTAGVSGPHALFVGHLGYRPNIEAVRRLVMGIFPKILAAHPTAQLEICGRNPHPKLLKFFPDQPEVSLVADPSDLAPAYARASMALIPLSQGGGTRLKVLEAMALGVPVIATAKAVEGLDVVPGQTFLQAETDADFVHAVAQMNGDASLRKRLIDAGRAYALTHHSQSAIDKAVHPTVLPDVR